MLFRRRNPLSIAERARLALWTTSSWRRSASYVGKRVLRLGGSPHTIAAGFAAGVFTSFTPFIFFHFIISVLVALLIGGNILAALLGTAVGNPLTFPAMYLTSYNIGTYLLGQEHYKSMPNDISLSMASQPWDAILPILPPLVVGGLPLGLGFGMVAYVVVLLTVKKYQLARRVRLEARRRASNQQDASADTPELI